MRSMTSKMTNDIRVLGDEEPGGGMVSTEKRGERINSTPENLTGKRGVDIVVGRKKAKPYGVLHYQHLECALISFDVQGTRNLLT